MIMSLNFVALAHSISHFHLKQVASKPQFKQRSKTRKTRRQPKPAPRYSQQPIAEEQGHAEG